MNTEEKAKELLKRLGITNYTKKQLNIIENFVMSNEVCDDVLFDKLKLSNEDDHLIITKWIVETYFDR